MKGVEVAGGGGAPRIHAEKRDVSSRITELDFVYLFSCLFIFLIRFYLSLSVA